MKQSVSKADLVDAVNKGLEETGSYASLSEKTGVHPNTLRKWHCLYQIPRVAMYLRFKKRVEELARCGE